MYLKKEIPIDDITWKAVFNESLVSNKIKLFQYGKKLPKRFNEINEDSIRFDAYEFIKDKHPELDVRPEHLVIDNNLNEIVFVAAENYIEDVDEFDIEEKPKRCRPCIAACERLKTQIPFTEKKY